MTNPFTILSFKESLLHDPLKRDEQKEVCISYQNKQASHKPNWYVNCLTTLSVMCISVLEENQDFYIVNVFFVP